MEKSKVTTYYWLSFTSLNKTKTPNPSTKRTTDSYEHTDVTRPSNQILFKMRTHKWVLLLLYTVFSEQILTSIVEINIIGVFGLLFGVYVGVFLSFYYLFINMFPCDVLLLLFINTDLHCYTHLESSYYNSLSSVGGAGIFVW